MLIPNRFFSPFKLYLHRDSGTALMLNPKVLTTFTRQLLVEGYAAHLGRADPSDHRWQLLHMARLFPLAPARDYLDFMLRPDRYALFAFVRNPYGRIASAWKNKFLDAHTGSVDGRDADYPRSVRKRHLHKVRRFAATHDLPGSRTGELVPFDTFLSYAAATPERQLDHHWAPQTQVLLCDRLSYTRVYPIETELETGFVNVMSRIGLPAGWIRDKLGTRKNPSSAKVAIYTEALAQRAWPLCRDDLSAFGYAADSWRQY